MSTIKSSAENLTLNADGANNDVLIQSNGSTKVTVDGATGNVGIGTDSPDNRLTIKGTSHQGLNIRCADGYNATLSLSDTSGSAYESYVRYHTDTNNMSFAVNGAERMRILAAGGITFNGDTAAANALDDYEEGTWTPSFIGGTSAGSYTLSTPYGSYTKIGNLVHIRLSMWNITTSSAGSGNIRITGLPYTASNNDGRASIGTLELDNFTFSGSLSATAEQNTTYIELRQSRTNAADYIMQVGDKTNNSADLAINITYRVD